MIAVEKKKCFKNYSCWRINTVKWRVGTQRAIDTTVSERDLFSRGKSLARECFTCLICSVDVISILGRVLRKQTVQEISIHVMKFYYL